MKTSGNGTDTAKGTTTADTPDTTAANILTFPSPANCAKQAAMAKLTRQYEAMNADLDAVTKKIDDLEYQLKLARVVKSVILKAGLNNYEF